jgi:hypothetical protein
MGAVALLSIDGYLLLQESIMHENGSSASYMLNQGQCFPPSSSTVPPGRGPLDDSIVPETILISNHQCHIKATIDPVATMHRERYPFDLMGFSHFPDLDQEKDFAKPRSRRKRRYNRLQQPFMQLCAFQTSPDDRHLLTWRPYDFFRVMKPIRRFDLCCSPWKRTNPTRLRYACLVGQPHYNIE